MSLDLQLSRIKQEFPDIEWDAARLIAGGWDHDVVVLDQSLVFRVRKNEANASRFDREARYLEFLATRTSVPIPRVSHLSSDRTIMGYPYLPGDPLDEQTLMSLGSAKLTAVLAQISTFLSEVHRIPIADCAHLQPVVRRAEDHVSWLSDGLESNLRGVLSPEECEVVEAFLPELGRCMSSWSELVLLHGDFGYDDVILDADSGQVSIIDHTDYAIGDPALDFWGLLAASHEITLSVLEGYSHRNRVGNVLERAETYSKMVTIGMMIHCQRWSGKIGHLDKWLICA